YLTINPFIDDGFFDLKYLNSQPAEYEDEYLRHIRFEGPLEIIINGKDSKAAIFKKEFKAEEIQETTDDFLGDLPPEGFM
ncbi:MAG: hypothetical protein JJE07_09955, partial [Flavobacteriaceae bacterium]|nr:hypothetical protein [Flavobacteriaceae bacterium]